ncbi:MAG: hypothetical protein ACRCT6_08940, partial [Notoacmeibacter sp.]
MNAKMRIGHFSQKQHLRLRVKMAAIKMGLISAALAIGVANSFASGLQHHDTNLERWAKESLAKRMGDMRDSYHAGEKLRMVTEIDIKRGPLPLSAERNNEPYRQLEILLSDDNFIAAESAGESVEKPARFPENSSGATPYPPRRPYSGAILI